MKMVAASKLRKTQEQAQNGQPYSQAMAKMLSRVAKSFDKNDPEAPKLLAGTGAEQKHLLIAVTADRGLCGGFNSSIVKETTLQIKALEAEGKEVSIICIGRKGFDVLNREHSDKIVHVYREVFGKDRIEFTKANEVAELVLSSFDIKDFDVCTLIYNKFVSVLVQEPTKMQIIPFKLEDEAAEKGAGEAVAIEENAGPKFPYSYEPSEEAILGKLLPRNVGIQIYSGMLNSAAGEQAARMTAMDNATRNAGDMIDGLTLQYNRARQAYITKELIEIISGAEAV